MEFHEYQEVVTATLGDGSVSLPIKEYCVVDVKITTKAGLIKLPRTKVDEIPERETAEGGNGKLFYLSKDIETRLGLTPMSKQIEDYALRPSRLRRTLLQPSASALRRTRVQSHSVLLAPWRAVRATLHVLRPVFRPLAQKLQCFWSKRPLRSVVVPFLRRRPRSKSRLSKKPSRIAQKSTSGCPTAWLPVFPRGPKPRGPWALPGRSNLPSRWRQQPRHRPRRRTLLS